MPLQDIYRHRKPAVSKPVSIVIAVILTICVCIGVTVPVVKYGLLKSDEQPDEELSPGDSAQSFNTTVICACQPANNISSSVSYESTTTITSTTTEAYIYENVNHARHKPSYQSSTGTFGGGPADASRANDGDRDPDFYHYSCSHTMIDPQDNPWWYVYLDAPVEVRQVLVQPRSDSGGDSMLNLTVSAGTSLTDLHVCAVFPGPVTNGKLIKFNCENAIVASYVKVELPGEKTHLALCEVEVYSYVTDQD